MKKLGIIISLFSIGIVFLSVGIFFLVDFNKPKAPIRYRRSYFKWCLDGDDGSRFASYLNKPIILKEQQNYKLLIIHNGPYSLDIDAFIFEYDSTIFEIICTTPYDPEYPVAEEISYSLFCKKKATNAKLNIYLSYYESMSYPEDYYRTLDITVE